MIVKTTSILIKRGNKADLPTLLPGELGFCLDTKELFIGTREKVNKNLTSAEISIDITTDYADDTKTASPKAVKTYVDTKTSYIEEDLEKLDRTLEYLTELAGNFGIVDYPEQYLTFRSLNNFTITPKYTNSGVSLQYSLDGATWNSIESGAESPQTKKIMFRGKATGTKTLYTSSTDSGWTINCANPTVEVYGNINSLLDSDFGAWNLPSTYSWYAFSNMFRDQTKLKSAKNLILTADALGGYCYQGMFRGCTSLITAPKLPATTLANNCYYMMFYNCLSLTTAPELPATKLESYCYYNMFFGCRSLTTPPKLPATSLAISCYYGMFYNASSLITAPELPATTLIDYCYNTMFYSCSSLKVSETQTEEFQYEWRIPTTGTISAERPNWNSNMLLNAGGTFTSDPQINTIYYTDKEPV